MLLLYYPWGEGKRCDVSIRHQLKGKSTLVGKVIAYLPQAAYCLVYLIIECTRTTCSHSFFPKLTYLSVGDVSIRHNFFPLLMGSITTVQEASLYLRSLIRLDLESSYILGGFFMLIFESNSKPTAVELIFFIDILRPRKDIWLVNSVKNNRIRSLETSKN